MVAGMAAPAYADVYYIGDGNITITKDESGTYVKHSGNDTATKDNDGKIVIKGGKRSEDTPAPGGGSSEGTTPAKSPAKSMSATPPSEDSENNDMVYLGDTKGSGEENKNQPNNTTGGEENKNQLNNNTTGNEENKNQPGGTTGGEENENQPGGTTGGEENENQPSGTTGNEENENQTGGTTGGEENENQSDNTTGNEENENQTGDTIGGEENKNQPSGTTGGEKNETDFTKKTQPSDSPVLESQIMYTGPSFNVANANDDDETPNESTTALKTAAENFRNTAENVTNYVIKIINKVKDSTLNVTLEDVNIKANNDAALSVEGAGNTKITLSGSNTLTGGDGHAGLEHNEKSKDDNDDSVDTGKLTITSEKDSGILTATGGSGAAGIGSSNGKGTGTIEITGGNITANGGNGGNGGDNGAGIGSGSMATGNTNITISGGTVKAQGGDSTGISGKGGTGIRGDQVVKISGGAIGSAKGGSGDVLSGVVLALLGLGMDAFDACCCAVWLHGRAGDLAAQEKGQWGMTPTDLLERLPQALREVTE